MELPWWYISYADGNRPAGSQWLGACFVRATDAEGAIREAWRRGCNPGGEAIVVRAPAGLVGPRKFARRLLSRADVDAYDEAVGVI